MDPKINLLLNKILVGKFIIIPIVVCEPLIYKRKIETSW